MASQKKYIDLLMVGKTGNGKSATGNSILRRKAFKSMANTSSITQTAQFDFAEFEDCILKVVDGPGVGDTKLDTEGAVQLVLDAMTFAIAANPAGYHAILIIVRFGTRFTKEDVQCVHLLKDIFGEDFIKYHAILVLTCGEAFEHETEETKTTLDEWCKSQEGPFNDLLKECRNRVAMFDNLTKDAVKRDDQIRKLLKIVDDLARSGVRYNNEHFKKAQQARERMFLESKRPRLTEETLREVGVITQQCGRVDFNNPKGEMSTLQNMKERADVLEKSLNEQDKGTNALSVALNLVKNLQKFVDEQIELMKEALATKMKEEKIKQELGWVAESESGVSSQSFGSVKKLLERFKREEKEQDEQRIKDEERKRKEMKEAREREENLRESLRHELKLEEEKRQAAEREEKAREAEKRALDERERTQKLEQELEELSKKNEEMEKKEKEAKKQFEKLEKEYQKMKEEETKSYWGSVVDAVAMPIQSFSKWWWGK